MPKIISIPLKKPLLIDEYSDSFRELKTPSPKNLEEGLLWTIENVDSGYFIT
jgi:hypothetical protein